MGIWFVLIEQLRRHEPAVELSVPAIARQSIGGKMCQLVADCLASEAVRVDVSPIGRIERSETLATESTAGEAAR
jgi:hypothetical protein